jgi:hypothetical protein
MDDADRAGLFLNRIGAAVFDFIRLIRVVYSAIPVIGRYRVVDASAELIELNRRAARPIGDASWSEDAGQQFS